MIKIISLAALAVAALVSTADARTRVRVVRAQPQGVAFNPQPNAVLLCPWVALSVPPDTKPGDISLGICPPRSMFDYNYPRPTPQ